MPENQDKPKYMKFVFLGAVLIISTTMIISNVLIAQRPIYVQNNSGIDGKPVNNISVSAVGKVSVKPDIVTFVTGYSITKQNDMISLQKDLNLKNNAIIKALKDAGIEDKDISTAYYNIEPNYRYDSSARLPDGYNGTIKINVKVRNIDKAGDIIDKSINAGANVIESISFTVDDLEKVREEARILATKAAKTKAQVLADASGSGLGALISISETGQSNPTPIYYNAVKEVASDSSGAATTISAGSLEIMITVDATFGIK